MKPWIEKWKGFFYCILFDIQKRVHDAMVQNELLLNTWKPENIVRCIITMVSYSSGLDRKRYIDPRAAYVIVQHIFDILVSLIIQCALS